MTPRSFVTIGRRHRIIVVASAAVLAGAGVVATAGTSEAMSGTMTVAAENDVGLWEVELTTPDGVEYEVTLDPRTGQLRTAVDQD
jgi:hypothetical protein